MRHKIGADFSIFFSASTRLVVPEFLFRHCRTFDLLVNAALPTHLSDSRREELSLISPTIKGRHILVATAQR